MQEEPKRRVLVAAPARRWRGLLVGCGVAVLVHLIALAGLRWTWGGPALAPQPPRSVQVRALRTATAAATPATVPPKPAAAAAPTVQPVAAPELAGSLPPSPRKSTPKVATATARAATPEKRASTRPAPVESSRLVATPRASVETAPTEPTAEPPATDDDTIPSYRTLIPPAATLRYQARRGSIRASGELRWRPGSDGYALSLDVDAGGGPALLAQASRGGFDAAGLAPSRFTEKRLRRPASAANFQRDAGKITFSGPSTEYPLRAGSQDRLSWLLQLGAIVAAEPALREKGARVVMNVVGAHGDAGVWTFVCNGTDDVEGDSGGSGRTGQLGFRREPPGPYETAAIVVLDPVRGYLPSRVTLKFGGNVDDLELRLQDGTPWP